MALYLARPMLEHEAAWKDIVSEIQNAGERIVPYALALDCQGDYPLFLTKTQHAQKGENLGSFVPADLYFLLDTDIPGRILGAIHIRRRLNPHLLEFGGHIGYGIRPTERRKGYAAAQLKLALEQCRELGLDRVLLTCEPWNTASARTIQKCGGVLEDQRTDGEKTFARYWITL